MKSTYAPLRILSTSFPGIGGKADERMSELCPGLSGAGRLPLIAGSGVASRVAIDGTDGTAPATAVELDVDDAGGAAPEIRGTEEMAAGGGIDPIPATELLTVQMRGRRDNEKKLDTRC